MTAPSTPTWRFPAPIRALACTALLAGSIAPAFGAWYDSYDFAAKGVVAFWPLDGDALDRSGQSNDGTWVGSNSYEPGRFGQSRSLTPGTYLTVPAPPALSSFSAITLSAWYKTTTIPSDNESLMGIGLDGAGPLHAYLFVLGGGSINGLVFNAWSSDGAIGGPNTPEPRIFDGTWHLLTASWDGTRSRLYLDSTMIAENPNATGTVAPGAGEPLYINRHNWSWGNSSRLTGAVDDPVVFDHALSDAEVAALASDLDNNGVADYWETSTNYRIVAARGTYPTYKPWIANLDGSQAQLLADVALASWPRLANNTVVFMAEDYLGQGPGIYRMTASPGAAVTKVPNSENIRTANGANWDGIDLSPDGSRVVWAGPEPGDSFQNHNVYVIDLDGSGKTRILSDPSKHFTMLNWGEPSRITVQRSDVGNAYSQRPFTVAPDGSGLTQVVADFAQNVHVGGPGGRAAMVYGSVPPPLLATMDNAFNDFLYVPGLLPGYSVTSWHPTEDVLFGARDGNLYRIDRATGTEMLLLEGMGAPFIGGDVGTAPPATGGATVTLEATQDSFIRQGAPDTNEGAGDGLRIQSTGKNRVLVSFDLSGILPASVTRARLILTISDLTDNWGPSGRAVSAHRLLSSWAEGNARMLGGNDRGTGPGVTWTCPTDSEIANQRADCSGTEWTGGAYAVATGPAVIHTNGMAGAVEFDVTADVVQGAASGWLISKDLEGQNGKVYYFSREGAALAGNPALAPRLVLDLE